MEVVCIRDVRVGDGNTVLLHRRNVRKGRRRGHPIEAWKAGVSEGIGDWVSKEVDERHAGRRSGQDRIDLLGAEEPLVADVATRLSRQKIALAGGTECRALRTVNREADEIALDAGARLRVRRSLGVDRLG